MTPARSEIEIDVPVDRVWSLISEFRHWPTWGPSVRCVEADVDAVALGVTGRVQTAARFWVPFEITECEAGRSWQWSVAGVRATGHVVKPLSEQRTRVEFSVPRIFLPYTWVLARGLRRLKKIAEAD